MKKTLDQERASHALEKIKNIQENSAYNEDWQDKYASYAESLPATILSCGLGQAAAMLLAASKKNDGKLENDSHYVLYKNLEEWLCQGPAITPYQGEENLMTAITTGDRQAYIWAQAEALKWLEWMKKLAVAYLKKTKVGERP